MEKERGTHPATCYCPRVGQVPSSHCRSQKFSCLTKGFYFPYKKQQLRHYHSLTIIIIQSFKGRFEANFKSPNKERAALSMGCLLERSFSHLIPGARRSAPAPRPGFWPGSKRFYTRWKFSRGSAECEKRKARVGWKPPAPLLLPNASLR